MMINKFLLAGMIVAGFATSAFAADLPSTKAPPAAFAAAPFSWAGSYIGADIGYGWARDAFDYGFNIGSPAPATTPEPAIKMQGLLGGLYGGHNWQSGNIVYGVELDAELTGIHGTLSGGYETYKLPEQGSARVRLGYAMDRTLLYATGGLAIADGKFVDGTIATTNRTLLGWTLGAGLEYAISNHWLARAEYRYTDFGTDDQTNVSGREYFSYAHHVTEEAVRVGLAYKFCAPEPVVAKY